MTLLPRHQAQVALGEGGRHRRLRQVRVNLKIQPRRTPFDAAKHQVFDRIEADHTARDRFSDPGQHIVEAEHLQQAQDLDELTLPSPNPRPQSRKIYHEEIEVGVSGSNRFCSATESARIASDESRAAARQTEPLSNFKGKMAR
jgi:hypothetical protein